MSSLIKKPQFMIVSLVSHMQNKQITKSNEEELSSLVDTYGGFVKAFASQNASHKDGATYIGEGKAQELSDQIVSDDIDVVVINDNLKTSQIYALRKIFEEKKPNIRVWDRTDLILHIFEKHATTTEAKLQIKLAYVKHKGPEARELNLSLSKQGAGVGSRGQGETNTVLLKRHWKEEMRTIQKELGKIGENRAQQMKHRRGLGLPTISIVGYTNAGKSTLFNVLSKKNTLAKNALFATLDSSVGKFYLPKLSREAFITDTIGFIQNLPAELIQSFSSTLMETVNADVILHVIDASDDLMMEKILAVEDTLIKLHMENKKYIYVFNKVDIASSLDKEWILKEFEPYTPKFICAKMGEGIQELIDEIQKKLSS